MADTQGVFARQNPEAIDAGGFHNDVIAVGNENLLLVHEPAFLHARSVISELRPKDAALNRGHEFNGVNRHYRDKLRAADLADPELLEESQRAWDELTQLLALGSIYPFQD